QSCAARAHAAVYSERFLYIGPSIPALAAIIGKDFGIDRWRLARYVVWAKIWLGPNRPWRECTATGYPPERPPWMWVWLLIIADNTLHVLCNALALAYL